MQARLTALTADWRPISTAAMMALDAIKAYPPSAPTVNASLSVSRPARA